MGRATAADLTDGSHYRLTESEWDCLERLRAGVDLAAVASGSGLGMDEVRRTLAVAAEKLRQASLPGVRPESATFEVPALRPCPYCENYEGRYGPNGAPAVVVEDDLTVVFLTAGPMGGMPGHLLVTTRRHAETICDVTPEEEAALGRVVADAVRALRAAFDPPGVLVQQNNGLAAFQTVPHVHFHVVPKRVGPFPPSSPVEIVPPAERMEQAEVIRRHWPRR